MKHLALSLLMASTFLFSFVPYANAQDIPDDDDEIIIVITEEITENGPTRSIIPITATYSISSSCLDVVFLDNIGNVDILITDLASGSSTVYHIQSSVGEIVIPINPGCYFIEFNLSYSSFYGYLII